MHREKSFPFPVPSPGYRVSGKEVQVRDSGSQHHQLCGCCNLQLIQSHVSPSHGPPARTLSPLFFLAKSHLLPKPRGKKKHSNTSWSSSFPFRTTWSSLHFTKAASPSPFSSKTLWSSLSLHQNPVDLYLSTSEPHGPLLFSSEPRGSPSLWLPRLGLNPSAHLPLQPYF